MQNIINPAIVGKRFIISGDLSQPREVFAEIVNEAGGEVLSGFSGNVDFILAGKRPVINLDDARSLGAVVLDEDSFMELMAS